MDKSNILHIKHQNSLDMIYVKDHNSHSLIGTLMRRIDESLRFKPLNIMENFLERIDEKTPLKSEGIHLEYFYIFEYSKTRDKQYPIYNSSVIVYPKYSEVEYVFDSKKILESWMFGKQPLFWKDFYLESNKQMIKISPYESIEDIFIEFMKAYSNKYIYLLMPNIANLTKENDELLINTLFGYKSSLNDILRKKIDIVCR
ncbi:MAG: hypothetical protein ACP5NV_06000 [Candidatus Woesearchaeota archaeon]